MTSTRMIGFGGSAVDELVVKRWRKGGKDRLYVNRPGPKGEAVAWYDCKTGELHVHVEELRKAASTKITEWLRHQDAPGRRKSAHPTTPNPPSSSSPAGPPSSPKPPQKPPPATRQPPPARQAAQTPRAAAVPPLPTLTPGDDLASNRPGAALQEMARAAELEHKWLVRIASRLTRGTLVPERIRSGLAGELAVGTALERLTPTGWHILHGIKWPRGSDIDHLAIGPSGVFTVNAKHHAGASVWVGDVMLRVNGGSTDHLRNSMSEATRTAELLRHWCGRDIPVQPVIGVVGAQSIKIDAPDPRVLVIDGTTIDHTLAARPPILSAGQVASIYAVARHRQVWLTSRRRNRPH
ncbi:nuclease-related domain-containing protein [Streptomyces sp. CB02959]|uniref:nuclease-related domain-containing protein n=1 Tax=Streptomyces sp. CB02959 TaxID=2020330 RepID=UPI0011AF2CC4|nr:nuclease-related domain-containing protein [Streptomyces sp. CB02959]